MPEQLIGNVEPVFPVLESADLRFPSIYGSSLVNYFCHCIARNPGDLRSHVRRIVLVCEHGRNADIFAALLDLFIALGKKGLGLRGRMLELSRARLKAPQYELLRDSLAGGLNEMKVPIAPGSILCRGTEGSLNLIRHGTEKRAEPRDPLLEAQEYLEYSQIDEARSVLENAVLEAPSRTELHYALLEIYRLTRDQTGFAEMFHKIDEINNPMSDEWEDLAEFFRRSHG